MSARAGARKAVLTFSSVSAMSRKGEEACGAAVGTYCWSLGTAYDSCGTSCSSCYTGTSAVSPCSKFRDNFAVSINALREATEAGGLWAGLSTQACQADLPRAFKGLSFTRARPAAFLMPCKPAE